MGPMSKGERPSNLSLLGIEFGRHTGAYGLGSGITLLLALVQVAIVTRFLGPAEFGQLALLLFLAALLTITYSLGLLQGTLVRVYGASGEEEADDGDGGEAPAGEKRRSLGTGMAAIAIAGLVGTLLLLPFSGSLAELLVGDRGEAELVAIALFAGGLGALWRLVQNVPRMERQPRTYVALATTRSVLVLVAVTALVASGGGIGGAMLGTAIGSVVALAVGLAATRSSWVPSFNTSEVRQIWGRGFYMIPVIISFWIVQNADLFALSRYVSDEQVGFYRLAGRIAAVVGYATSAFLLAWLPIRRAASFAAAQEEHGRAVEGTVLSYYAVASAGLLVAMSVGADLLVQIAPPEYSGAAPLVPLIGAAFIAHGLLIAVRRASQFPDQRRTYVAVVVASVGLFVIAAMALIPRLGPEGAALAVVAAFLPGVAWIAFRSQVGPNPIDVSGRRLFAVAGVTAACLVATRWADGLAGPAHTAAHLAILLAFPTLIIATGAIPRSQLRSLGRIARAMVKRPDVLSVGNSLRRLDAGEAAVLRAAVNGGKTPAEIAAAQERTPPEVASQLTAAMRTVTAEEGDRDRDALIGLHLFSRTSFADRQANGKALMNAGVGAGELATLELGVDELGRLSEADWPVGAVVLADELVASCVEEEEAAGMPPGMRRELRVLSRRRMKVMLRDETEYGDYVRYVVSEPATDSRALLVSFSSARDTPPGYSYVRECTRGDCTTLFLRLDAPSPWGTNGGTEVADEVFEFLPEFLAEREIDPADVIATGGSAGGGRALSYGVGLGLGYLLVGAPVVALGDFMFGQRKRESDRRLLRAQGELWAGGGDDRAREWLNGLIIGRLREPGTESPVQPARPTAIHLFISERDPVHGFTTQILEDHCAISEQLSLEITWSDYEGHTVHKDHFRRHLPGKLGELIGLINNREPAAARPPGDAASD